MDLVIGNIIQKGMDLIDDVFTSGEEKAEAQHKLQELAQKGNLAELNAFLTTIEKRAEVITAEANSEHWITSTWRPLSMLVMLGLITARWFGWEAPNMSQEEYLRAWDMLELGIVGYIASRGVEKTAKIWKAKKSP